MPNYEPPASIDPLGPFAVLLSAALILINAAISVRFSLGLHRTLAVASLRCAPHLAWHQSVSSSHQCRRWQECPLVTNAGIPQCGMRMEVFSNCFPSFLHVDGAVAT